MGDKVAETRTGSKLDGDLIEPGSICEVKRLYNHSSSSGRSSAAWSIYKDPRMEDRRLKDLTDPYAIVHRFSKKQIGSNEAVYVTHSIEAKSQRLKDVLTRVFRDYPEWNADEEPFTFRPPFWQFYHRWEALRMQLIQVDKSVHEEVKILIDELIPDVQPFFDAYDVIKDTGLVSFDDLWLIFAPGEEVLTFIRGHLCACRLAQTSISKDGEGVPFLSVKMEQFDWNGSYCGFRGEEGIVKFFPEPKLVTKLNIFPFKLAGTEQVIEGIQSQLEERGERFAELRGVHVKKCVGKKYVSAGSPRGVVEPFPRPVSWRVVIDAYAFYTRQRIQPPSLRRNPEGGLPGGLAKEPKELGTEQQHLKQSPASDERKEELPEFNNMERRLAVPYVRGFDLRTKEWCEFNIDELDKPGWSDVAYNKLVLAKREKELIMAFADRDLLKRRIFDDIVPNKGRGIIFLLCGSPGVGKTLTAEAVADKSQLPLYILGANDLGTSEKQVDEALENAFECCRLWDAVLLLDEADVFLEKRAADQLKRNELVSIFLRRLESYQGLMFLTTNRTGAIDDAFRSRMDLIFRYPDLNESARYQVWENFLGLLPEGSHNITNDDIKELAKEKMNGREIKSLIKTAHVLALRDSEGRLAMDHLNVVLDIRKRVESFENSGLET